MLEENFKKYTAHVQPRNGINIYKAECDALLSTAGVDVPNLKAATTASSSVMSRIDPAKFPLQNDRMIDLCDADFKHIQPKKNPSMTTQKRIHSSSADRLVEPSKSVMKSNNPTKPDDMPAASKWRRVQPEINTPPTGFTTGLQELKIQQAKRFGLRPPPPPPPSAADPTLSSANGIPRYKPVVPIENKAASSGIKGGDDERLRNIDPKMIELIQSEILERHTKIDWADIAGLDYAKSIIKEAVVLPLLRPDIFTGLRAPPRGILLFGPPGTGKTLIGKCIASQSKSTFFSISASSLTSKWIGDGEKLVRALFAVAAVHQPAVYFVLYLFISF